MIVWKKEVIKIFKYYYSLALVFENEFI